MAIHFSRIVSAQKIDHGASFSVQRLDLNGFGGALSPIAGMDHYRMSSPTFAPHPHAGFSAVSYLFEDSPGGLRNRDSQGHDFVVEPGAIVWTQAGSGVMHEERPVETGVEVHGIQLFVNLTAKHKLTPPQMYRLARHEVPEWHSPDGDRVRIVVGELNGVSSPLEPTEPFHLFDVRLQRRLTLFVQPSWNAMIYVLSGELQLSADGDARTLREGNAITLHSDGGQVVLETLTPTHVLVLSGHEINEPIFAHGPFIMNDRAQVMDAVSRFQAGAMGQLAPL